MVPNRDSRDHFLPALGPIAEAALVLERIADALKLHELRAVLGAGLADALA